jgi:hypothetical protein
MTERDSSLKWEQTQGSHVIDSKVTSGLVEFLAKVGRLLLEEVVRPQHAGWRFHEE